MVCMMAEPMLITDPDHYSRLLDVQHLLVIVGITAWLLVETVRPALAFEGAKARLRHILRNAAIWLMAGVVLSFVVGSYLTYASVWLEVNRIGLLLLIGPPTWVLGVVGVLLMDLGDYLFHRISHRSRVLWLLHAVHHSDQHLDFSTSLRVHPLHAVALVVWKLVFLAAMGIPIWAAMLRDALGIAMNLFHHANVAVPNGLDHVLRKLVVTPSIHRIHHSPVRASTDSNFGGLFVFWDKAFGTYREPLRQVPEEYGLYSLKAEQAQTVWGMLCTPWTCRHRPIL
jgi:sterol desaturase/sphingolipid hydroxylase (fatty acid hydroxylase superfamily)